MPLSISLFLPCHVSWPAIYYALAGAVTEGLILRIEVW